MSPSRLLASALAVTTAAAGLLVWRLAGDESAPTPGMRRLSNPYCAPDASPSPRPPELPPFPPPPRLGDVGPAFEPLAGVIVEVASLAPTGLHQRAFEWAGVEVRSVLWTKGRRPISPGETLRVEGPASVWPRLETALGAGARVLLGLTFDAEGGWSQWAVVLGPDPPRVLRGDPWLEQRDTGTLRLFLRWERNPFVGIEPGELLVAWNAEFAVTRYDGPLWSAWEAFVDEVPIGSHPAEDSPVEWALTPRLCRSIRDAPPGVRATLAEARMRIRIPPSWASLEGLHVCTRTPIASGPCSRIRIRGEIGHVEKVRAHAVPGEPVGVQIAATMDGWPSWIRRTTVASVPWEIFSATGYVLVELPDGAPGSYAELTAHPARYSGASVRAVGPNEFVDYPRELGEA